MAHKMKSVLFIFSLFALSWAQNNIVLVEYPTLVMTQESKIWFKWADPLENLNNCKIYFSSNPGGSDPKNYSQSLSIDGLESNNVGLVEGGNKVRGIAFYPKNQPSLDAGISYAIVAQEIDDGKWVSSNEIKMIIQHTEQPTNFQPRGGVVDDVTPQFSWTKSPGVPYSYVIVSDEEIKVGNNPDGSVDMNSVVGASLIWQAITADTRIVYGAPDPSGVFKSGPPPLSPGKTYTWLVFNNYGNHPSYTSSNALALPVTFTIGGEVGTIPVGVYPPENDTLTLKNDEEITFKWKNLDSLANTYKVFLYTEAVVEGIEAQMLVWSDEVTAGVKPKDSLTIDSLTMNAKNILNTNNYSWRVSSVNKSGHGQAGEAIPFRYESNSGNLHIKTYERIESGGRVFDQKLALTQIAVEVLEGSMEDAILFYTDGTGETNRVRPVGSSVITATKDGYESSSATAVVKKNETTSVSIYLRRPSASIYGTVQDASGVPINLASIVAVSNLGDTVYTESLPDGNYVLQCKPAVWTVSARKTGFATSLGKSVSLSVNSNVDYNFSLGKNSYTFSGTVRNEDGSPLVDAEVNILSSGGVELAQIPSTSSTGRFSFILAPGEYRLLVTKTGFSSVDKEIIFSADQDQNIVLSSGAALITGTVYGQSWVVKDGSLESVEASVLSAKIDVVDTAKGTVVTSVFSDPTYGTFSISVPGGVASKFRLDVSANGFHSHRIYTDAVITAGKTFLQDVTIESYATTSGVVESSSSVDGMSISLRDRGGTMSTVVTTANRDGTFLFFRVPDGEYELIAAGQGLYRDTVIQNIVAGTTHTSSIVFAENGRFWADSTMSKAITGLRVTTIPAEASIHWVGRTAENIAIMDTTVTVTVVSPMTEQLTNANGYLLNGVVADPTILYTAQAIPSDPTIIGCVERVFVSSGLGPKFSDTIPFPFRYDTTVTAVDTAKTVVFLEKWKNVEIRSAALYYRQMNETTFKEVSDTLISFIGDTLISFTVTPKNPGNTIEFYFEVLTKPAVAGGYATTYSNQSNLFTRYIAADPEVITRMEILPNTDGAITIPLHSRMELFLKAYTGSQFAPLDLNNDASQFKWELVQDSTVASLSKTEADPSAIVSGNRAGKATLQVTLLPKGLLSVPTGLSSTVKLPISVTDTELKSLKILLLSQTENAGYITNNESVVFAVEARDKKDNLVSVMPTWQIMPEDAGEFDKITGRFVPDSSFIGRVFIIADMGSKIRDDYHDAAGERGLLITHVVNSDSSHVSNKKDAKFNFSVGVVKSGAITVSLDLIESSNSLERKVDGQGAFLISPIYEIAKRSAGNFAVRSENDSIEDATVLSLTIPDLYHSELSNTSSDTVHFKLAIWDPAEYRWEYAGRLPDSASSDTRNTDVASDDAPQLFTVDPATYDPKARTLSLPLGHLLNTRGGTLRAGIVARGLESSTSVSVSPNPFSPYVSPQDDYSDIVGMNYTVKGTCIKITPKGSDTKFDFEAQVSIYTANGEMVYRTQLNGLIPGQSYYLFWDGRQHLSQDAIKDVVSKKVLYVPGDLMCRNGRYFVNVTINDGEKKQRYTKEIILFK